MIYSSTQARALLTQTLTAVYRERPKVMSFLRSFSTTKESSTKLISIEVERSFEKIAVDVERGTEGNRNTWGKSTEKIFEPPYFREFFDATDIDLYDRLFGSTNIEDSVFAEFASNVVDRQMQMQAKIERAYEKMWADVFVTGILQFAQFNIDFKRKAASMVNLNLSTGFWSVAAHDLYADIQTACNFIRTAGKAQGGIYNMILGQAAFNAMTNNSVFQTRQNLFNMKLDDILPSQKNAIGGVLHGMLDVGSYKVAVWTYPEFYTNAAGVATPYIPDNMAIIVPANPNFNMNYAAVPQLFDGSPKPMKGAYLFGEVLDEVKVAHLFDVKSAGMPVPVAVDQLYTMQVIA